MFKAIGHLLGAMTQAFPAGPHHRIKTGPGRRSILNWRDNNKYSGAALRLLRAERGHGPARRLKRA